MSLLKPSGWFDNIFWTNSSSVPINALVYLNYPSLFLITPFYVCRFRLCATRYLKTSFFRSPMGQTLNSIILSTNPQPFVLTVFHCSASFSNKVSVIVAKQPREPGPQSNLWSVYLVLASIAVPFAANASSIFAYKLSQWLTSWEFCER